jgi:hypothetical protein
MNRDLELARRVYRRTMRDADAREILDDIWEAAARQLVPEPAVPDFDKLGRIFLDRLGAGGIDPRDPDPDVLEELDKEDRSDGPDI